MHCKDLRQIFYQTTLILILPLLCAGQGREKGLLWKISGKNIKSPTYLFGTLHVFDTSRYALPAPVFELIKKVRSVYFEVDLGHINAAEMSKALWITDSSLFINKLIDTYSFAKLKKIAALSPTLSQVGAKINQLKPFYVTAFLMKSKNETSIDLELYNIAVKCKDSISGLETMTEQLNAVDAIPLRAQAGMLTDLLRTFHSTKDLMADMTRIYIRQDIDKMLEDLNHKMPIDASFNQELVLKRNLIMCYRIINSFGRHPMFIAVGAGHLGGHTGLISMLRNTGYTVLNIPFSFKRKNKQIYLSMRK